MTAENKEFNRKIRTRMLLLILSSAAAVLLLLGYALYATARSIVEEQVGNKVIGHLARVAGSVDAWLEGNALMVNGVAAALEQQSDPSPEAVSEILRAFGKRFETKDPFVGLEDGRYIDPAWTPEPGYDHRQRSWYLETKAAGVRTFSEPYEDGDTHRVIITLGVPLLDGDAFAGVVGLDVFPDKVLNRLREVSKEQSLEGFVVDGEGRYIAHPREEYILSRRIQDSPDGPAYETWRRSGKTSLVPLPDYYLAYWPIPSAGWTAVFRVANKAVQGPAQRLTLYFGGGAALALCVLAFVILWICRVLTRPILRLADGAGQMAKGEYDYRVPITTRDELGYLCYSFNEMATGLAERERIRSELAETRAEQARIDGELQAAHGIQLAMLPRKMPRGERFTLHALYQSAKEVGGDFYDFFPLPDGRHAFIVGDVSGKGVPAALFMAISCSILRICCLERDDPGAAVTVCNDLLAAHNEEFMFATLFLAYYDPATGACTYANGGHPEPLVRSPDGKVRLVPTLKDMVVGPMEDITYSTGSFALEPGDLCVIYTDGVTEAHAPDAELYGDDRLVDLVREHTSGEPAKLCEDIRRKVMDFQEGDQFDDLTLLAWRRDA